MLLACTRVWRIIHAGPCSLGLQARRCMGRNLTRYTRPGFSAPRQHTQSNKEVKRQAGNLRTVTVRQGAPSLCMYACGYMHAGPRSSRGRAESARPTGAVRTHTLGLQAISALPSVMATRSPCPQTHKQGARISPQEVGPFAGPTLDPKTVQNAARCDDHNARRGSTAQMDPCAICTDQIAATFAPEAPCAACTSLASSEYGTDHTPTADVEMHDRSS